MQLNLQFNMSESFRKEKVEGWDEIERKTFGKGSTERKRGRNQKTVRFDEGTLNNGQFTGPTIESNVKWLFPPSEKILPVQILH